MNYTKVPKILFMLFAVVFCFGLVSQAEPLGTAFTYQGRLIDNNQPADGVYDLQFKLFDAELSGNQLNGDVNIPDLDVIEGYFAVELDFHDANIFKGDARWLEIGVRPGDQNDPNIYTFLIPRQKLTPAPYALYAETSDISGGDNLGNHVATQNIRLNGHWLSSDGDNEGVYVTNDGDVGIGTTVPTEKLEVDGTVKATALVGDGSGLTNLPEPPETDPQVGIIGNNYVPIWDGSALTTGTIYDNSNVGIGTSSPATKLDVTGIITSTGGNSNNWNAAYTHKMAEDLLSGLVKCDGSGAYSAIIDDSTNWNAAYTHKTTEDSINGLVKCNGSGVYSAITDNSANWNTAYGWGRSFYNVKSYGAKGNGVDDDTSAFTAAITAAAGGQIYVPDGTYMLKNLTINNDTYLDLSPGATLKHIATNYGQMITFLANNLRIRGGTLDGNKGNHDPNHWPDLIAGYLESGKKIELYNTHFTNTVHSALYIINFGGTLLIDGCEFSQMSEGSWGLRCSGAIGMVTGEPNKPGFVRVSNSKFIADVPASEDGKSPGGMFFGAENMSTLEVEGCYFYGIGQMFGDYDISSIHVYPRWNGVRIVNNYFEQCAFTSICVKSVHNFICQGNVIYNGQTTSQFLTSEGAIAYDPGYQPFHENEYVIHPRAVISNNIVDNPGSRTDVGKVVCISVHGTYPSHANDVIIANNVLRNGGIGLYVVYPDNITIANNIIEGAADGNNGTEHGIRFHNAFGEVIISGNRITTPNGMGLICTGSATTSRWYLIGNTFNHSAPTSYACTLRGMSYVKFSGNTFNATAGYAVYITLDDTGNPMGWLSWDNSNTILAGTSVFNWNAISKATGFLIDTATPYNRVVPGEIGTLFRQTTGSNNVLWQSTGTTKTSWVPLATTNISPPVDSVTAVQIRKADGVTSIVNVDTANSRVGIGTISPARALHINDTMRIQPKPTAPSSPAEGDIYMDSTQHKLMVYDGNAWQQCW